MLPLYKHKVGGAIKIIYCTSLTVEEETKGRVQHSTNYCTSLYSFLNSHYCCVCIYLYNLHSGSSILKDIITRARGERSCTSGSQQCQPIIIKGKNCKVGHSHTLSQHCEQNTKKALSSSCSTIYSISFYLAHSHFY